MLDKMTALYPLSSKYNTTITGVVICTRKVFTFRKKSQDGPTEIAFSGSCLQLSGLFRCLNAKEDQINYSVILRITDGASGILEILREIL